MNTPARPTRAADLAALAMATDANGQVDLTALEAHRLILSNQTIQGLDAGGLINSICRMAGMRAKPAMAVQVCLTSMPCN